MSKKLVQIRTNYHERQFVYRYDVPAKILSSQFDYLDEDTFDGFFKYRNHWYHLTDFMGLPAGISEIWDTDSPLRDWDGYASDSFFSGVLIKVSEDCETYQVATYIS